MAVLCDRTIEELVTHKDLIVPYSITQLQPASYDVRLADIKGALSKEWATDANGVKTSITWWLDSKQFVLGSTIEKVCLPDDIVARIEGKSSLARLGIIVHTAGFIDPGFCGTLTLEITNLSDEAIPLKLNQLIAQIAFQTLDKPAARPYGHPSLGSHYQGQNGVTPSAHK